MQSLLNYYQSNNFNPVPTDVSSAKAWDQHISRRWNLYVNHLGIPLPLLHGKSVLEFGCGSGENSLVMASFGANLTLVEPNGQVLPRLEQLFGDFHFSYKLECEGIEGFASTELYDVVLAEGFLGALSSRDEMLGKISSLLKPGGLAVISFNDRYGSLLEMVRRLLLWHGCLLEDLDIDGEDSLDLAKKLYWTEFARINTTRTFEAWWRDNLVSPFFTCQYFWSYGELIPLIEELGCEFYSSSPKWCSIDNYVWYKNVTDCASRHEFALDDYRCLLPYFLTGLILVDDKPSQKVFDDVAVLVAQISQYTKEGNDKRFSPECPAILEEYLKRRPETRRFGEDLISLCSLEEIGNIEDLVHKYISAYGVRNLWGVPYHYMSFIKR